MNLDSYLILYTINSRRFTGLNAKVKTKTSGRKKRISSQIGINKYFLDKRQKARTIEKLINRIIPKFKPFAPKQIVLINYHRLI